MEAATLEQSSGDTRPVFVTGRRHRSYAVRLAVAALGLLLAGWLAALIVGLAGFSPLPELTFSGTGTAQPPAVAPDGVSRPALEDRAGAQAPPAVARPERDRGQANAGEDAAVSTAPSASAGGAQEASGQPAGEGAGSASPAGGGSPTQAPAPPGTGAAPASSGNGPPSFTPPASGEKSASPPRSNPAEPPGRTVSADPPGRAAPPKPG